VLNRSNCCSHVLSSCSRRYPLTIESGEGCYLKTTDGKKYLDCVSGIATCALGHNNPALTKAVADQMSAVHHCSNLYLIPEQAALANWLCDNSGADKAFFCNSGAEANEAAIKCARRHASNRGITVSMMFRVLSGMGTVVR
jgi:acetylornithine aminotransferase